LTSTFATVSTDIPSYEAIHGRIPLHYYRSLISDTFCIRELMNYPCPTRHDTQHTHEISYRFGSTDCISEVSWYIYPIEVNDCRDNSELIPGQPARRRVSDQVSRSQLQRIHHTRTRRLSIAASMIFDKLPFNWVNWRLQGWCQSPYVHQSRVTGNTKAGHSPEAIYELRAIHVDPHRRRQLKSRSPSTRLDGVIYVTEAAKKRKRAHTSNEVHLRGIREDLRNTHDSHLAMPPMAVPIAITFCKSQRNYLRYGWC